MKDNELRIGNYVNRVYAPYGNRTGQSFVEKIESGNSIDNLTLPSSFCEGIPLSEEWLVRFGFDSIGAIANKGFLTLEKDAGAYTPRITRHSYKDGIKVAEIVRLPRQIQYVHQLQNLWYAIIFEELTLNN